MSVGTAIGQQSRTRAGKPATYRRLAGIGGLIFAATLVAQIRPPIPARRR